MEQRMAIGSEALMLIIGGGVKMGGAVSDDVVWLVQTEILSDHAICRKLTAMCHFRYFKSQFQQLSN
jgi:hypothetical protein